jgi:hypothetical protein
MFLLQNIKDGRKFLLKYSKAIVCKVSILKFQQIDLSEKFRKQCVLNGASSEKDMFGFT